MDDSVVTFTIGFTKTSAENFFERLTFSGVRLVIDVRLHNTSQLSGFAKAEDLSFFLGKIGNIGFRHMPLLAPEEKMLDDYKKGKNTWDDYADRFTRLMAERRVEQRIDPALLDKACLLCSENTPHHCHRRLVCEYLNANWTNKLKVKHL